MLTVLFIAVIATILLGFIRRIIKGTGHRWYIKKARKILRAIDGNQMAPGQKFVYLRKINPYVFEELVLLGFDRHGYRITRNKRYSGDGGIDGRVSRDGKDYLVQCKRYKNHINPEHVEAFARICMEQRKPGFFVHTGKTGAKSWELEKAAGYWVTIISGSRLLRLLSEEEERGGEGEGSVARTASDGQCKM